MVKKLPSERYFKVTALVFESVAFRTLPPSALKLWVDLRSRYNGSNNGNISAALSTLRPRGWRSPETLTRALWELLHRGLLRRTREGKPGPFRLCALYAFTDLPTARNDRLSIDGAQPTLEFAHWVPGRSYAPASKARKLPMNSKKSLLQKPKHYRSNNRSVTASEIEALIPATASKTEAASDGPTGPEAAPVLASSHFIHRNEQRFGNRSPL
jgi:hypothetical protein